MTENVIAHELQSVLVKVTASSVRVIFALGAEADDGPAQWASYCVDIYGPQGQGGKRFEVRLWPTSVEAYIFDFADGNQANYDGSIVTSTQGRIVAIFHDASLGVPAGGNASGWSSREGADVTSDAPAFILT